MFSYFLFIGLQRKCPKKTVGKSDLLFRFRIGHGVLLTYLQHYEKMKKKIILEKKSAIKMDKFCLPSFNGFHNMVKVRLHGSPAEKFCGSGL